uniref:Uncharacterized protein n=1 Tax=Arundo donax TaxID=35708 RepID=A0A0A8YJI0_ARUDO
MGENSRALSSRRKQSLCSLINGLSAGEGLPAHTVPLRLVHKASPPPSHLRSSAHRAQD